MTDRPDLVAALRFAKAITEYGVHHGNCPYDSWNKSFSRCKCGLFRLVKDAETLLAAPVTAPASEPAFDPWQGEDLIAYAPRPSAPASGEAAAPPAVTREPMSRWWLLWTLYGVPRCSQAVYPPDYTVDACYRLIWPWQRREVRNGAPVHLTCATPADETPREGPTE